MPIAWASSRPCAPAAKGQVKISRQYGPRSTGTGRGTGIPLSLTRHPASPAEACSTTSAAAAVCCRPDGGHRLRGSRAPRNQLVVIVRLRPAARARGSAVADPQDTLPGDRNGQAFVQGASEVGVPCWSGAGVLAWCPCLGSDQQTRLWRYRSKTHRHAARDRATPWPLPPDEATCRRVVRERGALGHAAIVGRSGARACRSACVSMRDCASDDAGLYRRGASSTSPAPLGDSLSRARRLLYRRFFATHHFLAERVCPDLSQCMPRLVPWCDAHVLNCSSPGDGSGRPAPPTGHLAHRSGLQRSPTDGSHWCPERPAAPGRAVLDRPLSRGPARPRRRA